MIKFSAPFRHTGRSGEQGPFRVVRSLRILPLLGLLAAAGILFTPALASADSSSTLTVVGTSDVEDSGLIQNLIQPEFQVAYPQFTFKYDEGSTLEAITAAENGSDQASAMIVHAASLENQFVASGFSYNNQYGNAIFTNDFVLAGPPGDPAGVGANATHNIVQAFDDIATAGIAGGSSPTVTFVSRGGGSGTTVEEHQVWQLLAGNNPPAGLLLCTVPSSKGGGETPIAAGGVAAQGDPCPGGVLPGTTGGGALPPWYVVTGLDQGPNVLATNACTGFASPAGTSCYVLTDRGTFDYLNSGLDPAGTIPNLTKLTYGNSASAPGGVNELINYFHVYIINPNATVVGGTTKEPVNLPAAEDFVNFLTSPYFQSQLKSYLDDTGDPQGPPFVADASPIITDIGIPTRDSVGKAVTVTGNVTNAEPGYPALSDVPVTVDEIVAGLPVAIASGKTTTSGSYSIRFTPESSGAYQVSTGQISTIENSSLSPVFGDILSPSATTPIQVTVSGLFTSHTVSFRRLTTKKNVLSVAGTLAPGPFAKGATVKLLALRTTGSGAESTIGKAAVGAGKTTFTIKAKLAVGSSWILQLEYTQKGQASSFSGLKVIHLH